eukprot:scaffold70440_cov17-Tisochrysis_lutea.AAC.1
MVIGDNLHTTCKGQAVQSVCVWWWWGEAWSAETAETSFLTMLGYNTVARSPQEERMLLSPTECGADDDNAVQVG